MTTNLFLGLILMAAFSMDLCTPVAMRDNSFKPRPSNALPVLDIEETPPNESDPKKADLDPDLLRQKLGVAYKPLFMSPTKPELAMHPDEARSPLPRNTGHNRPGKMPSFIRKIDFDMPNGRGPRMSLNRRQRKKFQNWLRQATTCPVVYKWKNLGHRFWPPWIKEGVCDNSHSCSFPPGMGCQPSGSTNITVLRWHCQGFRSNKMKYCTWIKVQYPIISQCKCKC